MLNNSTDIYLSLIIPFYNSDKTLEKCVNSVLEQNDSRLEIILINDGSTDKSKKICNKLIKKYRNIYILEQKKNLGVSSSRNKGIKKAKGRFLIFLDSDDYLLAGSIRKIIKVIENNITTDLIIFKKFIAYSMQKTFIMHNIIKPKIKNNDVDKLFKELYNAKNIYGNIFNYIINRDFLFNKKIFFLPKVNFAEDQEFILKTLSYCTKFYFLDQSFYCYCSGSGNLSSSMTYNSGLSCLKVVCSLSKLNKSKVLSPIKKKYINKIIVKVLNQFIPRLLYIEKNEIYRLSKYINKNKNNFLSINYSFLKYKMFTYIKQHGYTKGMLNYRKIISDKLKIITKVKTSNQIYIFCFNYYGIAISKILSEKGFKVKGFIDNNKLVIGRRISGLKVYSPNILKERKIYNKKNILVIITNQFKKNIENITKQLIKLGISKHHIVNIVI